MILGASHRLFGFDERFEIQDAAGFAEEFHGDGVASKPQGLDQVSDIFLSKRKTDVDILCHRRRAMKDSGKSSDKKESYWQNCRKSIKKTHDPNHKSGD